MSMMPVQDSGAVSLTQLAIQNGGELGLVRVERDPGPWVLCGRYVIQGQPYGPGVFLNPALSLPFAYVTFLEGRNRAKRVWSMTREYYILRDITLQTLADTAELRVVVPAGLTGPFAQVMFEAWLVKGPTAQHELSGRLQLSQNIAGLQSAINVDGVDASIPRGATSFWCTLPTVGDTGAPIGPFPSPVDLYQLDAYGVAVQVNRIAVANQQAQSVCLSPLARFVGAVDTTGAVVAGTLPITWKVHG